ncbi:WXG100 family type VII secretion target [Actinokineospora bangkokensis]|uniref:Uncharacterized protein n=1 Tax=Actinokineospora bangkokensis TaxID=1193682 RepID=A0A1Q9LJJ8_9PSEU|nr:hypothetical protein [Actinokineospora bangkokensis]OLR92221.1 hypothetical protein BJP25_23150 [Actinokineospora bangkokensis]
MTDRDTAQMVARLRATDDAVNAKGWVAPGLGVPGAPMGLLTAATNPLGALASAGLSWFIPMVSFLGDGLTQLQGGDHSSVSSGSQDFGQAGRGIGDVAEEYRATTRAQTSGWEGPAAEQYRTAADQHAEGVAGLGQASTSVSNAIIGAGQVVAQAIAEVLELIAEAVSQIVPIMTQAIARAAETMGQSVVEAIPPCIAIAVEYALRIAAKLAALLASGDNLLKIVQGGMAVVQMIQQALTSISGQSTDTATDQAAFSAASAGEGAQQKGAGTAAAVDQVDDWAQGTASTQSASAGSGSGSPGAPSSYSGASAPSGSSGSSGYTPSVSAAVPPRTSSLGSFEMPETTRSSSAFSPITPYTPSSTGFSGGGGAGVSSAPVGGGVPFTGGAVGSHQGGGTGARLVSAREVESAKAQARTQPSRSATGSGGNGTAAGGMPMGAMGAGARGEGDKEHQRKYGIFHDHEEELSVSPQVITPRDDD